MTRADLDIRTRLAICASPTSLAVMLARSVAALPFLPRDGEARGYRIFSSSGGQFSYCDLLEGSHVVLGRHSLADVVLHAPSAALRHVVLWATRCEGKLVLRGHDLIDGTPIGFGPAFDDESRTEFHGPRSLLAGCEPIIALPDFGIPRKDEAKHVSMQAIEAMEARSLIRVAAPSHAWLTLDLIGPQGERRLERSQQALTRGMLIGRYPRCEHSSGSVFSDNVSRVHAMIVREGDGVLVLDLRSTNGLEYMGRSVRSVHVTSRALIQLGKKDAIEVVVHREAGE